LGGLFTQEDPIGLAGGLNLYGFANGDPINFRDPFGLAACGEGAEADDDTANKQGGDPNANNNDDDCQRALDRFFDFITSKRGRACVAGGLGFAFAAAEDISVFAGVGLALKGLKGARASTKLARGLGRALFEKNILLHQGARANTRNLGNMMNGFVGGASLDLAMDAGVDGDFTGGEFLAGMVPGVNMLTAGISAYGACAGG
jgi:hypothetical protein